MAPMRLQTTRQAGFTLMEMLITIAVLAILVSLAIPSFRQFIQNNRLSSEANELVAAMQYGRSEALRRGAEVRVCASNNQTSCTGSWNQGWIAVIDPGGSDEEVLRVWQSPGTDFQFSPANGTVDFNREGFSTSGAQTFDMQLEGCTTNNARQVQIEPSGRVASQRVNCPT
jgi:type IV fimbrial biogenesis protein FimT